MEDGSNGRNDLHSRRKQSDDSSSYHRTSHDEQLEMSSRCFMGGGKRWNRDMGFVLLDQEKEVIRGQCKGTQTESPLQAEAECLCWAMKEVSKRGLSQVTFESDCQQLVHIIQQKKHWHALDPELDVIEAMIPSFNVCYFKFISRSANVRADSLAKDVRSRVRSFSFFEVKDLQRLAVETSLYESS